MERYTPGSFGGRPCPLMTCSGQMKFVIEPGGASRNYWSDLWRYRELMYFLAWRDIAVRYKQTIIGVAWALIRPALTMLVFVGLFDGRVSAGGNVPEAGSGFCGGGAPHFFLICAVRIWGGLRNANLISKVYFPRLIIPCAAVVTSLVDFLITLGLLVALMLWYGFTPGWQIVGHAALFLYCLPSGFGGRVGSAFCRLNVEYRFPLHRTLHDPIWAVCVTDCIQHIGRATKLANALRAQSDGRYHRRFPLVHLTWSHAARSRHGGDFRCRHHFVSVSRLAVLPPGTEQLR